MIKPFYLLTDSTGRTYSHTNVTIHKQFSSVTYYVVILIWLVDKLGETCNTHLRKLKSTFLLLLPVADLTENTKIQYFVIYSLPLPIREVVTTVKA